MGWYLLAMARGHPGIPRIAPAIMRKQTILSSLLTVDDDNAARRRVLALEHGFRSKITSHLESLPLAIDPFHKFNTSPFVLLFQARRRGYSRISEIEEDILPAKLFSSMETSAGRMVEEVALPVYGWTPVLSAMHSANSALDGKTKADGVAKVATLKSGPRCLNDEMSENFADAIIAYAADWAADASASRVEFTYGVLYGTRKRSNKKDWHILRNLDDKLRAKMIERPSGRWDCSFEHQGVHVNASVRIGTDWWRYLGGELCLTEVLIALIRACVAPGDADAEGHEYTISDLQEITSMRDVPEDFNVSLLQRSQIPWMFLMASHFADEVAS